MTTETTVRRLSIAEALREAIAEEMERDPAVFCIGEDIGVTGGWGGAFTVTLGLEKRFPDRMISTAPSCRTGSPFSAGRISTAPPYFSAGTCRQAGCSIPWKNSVWPILLALH